MYTFSYPACNAHAPYCHLWPVRLYTIFLHSLIIGTILKKYVIEHKMCVFDVCFDFPYNFCLTRFSF